MQPLHVPAYDYAPSQAVAFAPYLVNKMGKKWHIAYADYAWGQSTRDAYAAEIKKAGGEVVGTTGIPLGTADMTPFLSKITGDFDGLFGIFFGKDGVTIGNQAYDLGLTKKYKWAGDGAIAGIDQPAGARQQDRGLRRHQPLHPGVRLRRSTRRAQEVLRRGQDAAQADRSGGPMPDRYVQSNFEAMNALKLGMEKSRFHGRADTEKLIAALEGLEMKEGDDFPQGDKTLRKEDHQAFLREFIFEIKDGKFKILEVVAKDKTIFPPACKFACVPKWRATRLDRRRAPRRPAGEAAPAPVLRTEDLTIRFGGLTALNSVNFEVQRGEIRAIIGPNGAGKSTFFNCLTGVLRPTSGRILLNGDDITGLPPNRISRKGIARSYQITNILPNATTLENVRIAAQSRRHGWNMLAAPSRLPRHHREGRSGARRRSGSPARPTSSPPTCRTASSATSRSASRLRPSRSSCASTSRPPA